MIKITEQEFAKRYDALPEDFREKFLSDTNINMLWAIGEAHHLKEERIQKIAGVIGYIILGLVHIEDLAKEIAVEAGIDKRSADEVAREIQVKILSPIIPQLQQLYHYGIAGAVGPPSGAAAVQATPPQPSLAKAVEGQPEIIRPAFTPPPQDQPFILHQEREEVEQARPRDEALVRPSFYTPPWPEAIERQEGQGQIERSAARLEIGGVEEEKAKEPQIGRTEEPPTRVVHYSGPQTPVDPFAPQQEVRTEEPPKEVHPENIVDLKDLPR